VNSCRGNNSLSTKGQKIKKATATIKSIKREIIFARSKVQVTNFSMKRALLRCGSDMSLKPLRRGGCDSDLKLVLVYMISYQGVRQKMVFVPQAVNSYDNGKMLARRLVPTAVQFIGHTLLPVEQDATQLSYK
jgi:hypothetical protein